MKFLVLILVTTFLGLSAQAQSQEEQSGACLGDDPICQAYKDEHTAASFGSDTTGAYAASFKKYNLKMPSNCPNCATPEGLDMQVETDSAQSGASKDKTGEDAGSAKARQ